ncbi:MAG: MBL fold metallo-hydrolase [Acidilobus sp.]
MEVLPGLYRVPVPETNGNAYILVRNGLAAVIDTGIPGKASAILDEASRIGLAPSSIEAIILTHFHFDHSGSADELRRLTGAKVHIHEADAPYLQGLQPPPLPREAPREAVEAYRYFRPVKPDGLLRDGDTVFGLRVIHIPGHTPGSIALYDGRLLFSGDTLNFREGRVQGPPPAFTTDMREAIRSLRRLLSLDFDVLLPGHGDPVTGGARERAVNDLREIIGEV